MEPEGLFLSSTDLYSYGVHSPISWTLFPEKVQGRCREVHVIL
jgi:hypothetical protein